MLLLVFFIDNDSWKACVYILKWKFDVFGTFKKFKTLVENENGGESKGLKINCLHSDNGWKYCLREFDEFCNEYGIK